METSELQKAIIGRILKNRPHPSDFDTLFVELYEPTTKQAFGRSVAACIRAGWLDQIRHAPAPGEPSIAATRELRVTPHGERAYASGDLSPQTNREEWKDVREPFIGSSDLAAILGMDEWKGPWDVWDRIVLGKWDDDTPGGDIRRGVKNEQNGLDRFEEVYGLEYELETMIHHPDHYELVSDVDGRIPPDVEWPEHLLGNPLWAPVIAAAKEGKWGCLELKVPRTAKFYQTKEEGMQLGWTIQMQHHLCVSGAGWGVFAIYSAEYDDVHAFPVMPHPVFQQQIVDIAPAWYQRYVIGQERPKRPEPYAGPWPPKPEGEATIVEEASLREQFELTKLRHWELEDARQQYADQEKALLEAVKELKDPTLLSDGVKVVRTSSKPRRQFDRKALRARILQLQENGDAEGLLDLDPEADEFFYLTNSRDKEDVIVFARPEQEG